MCVYPSFVELGVGECIRDSSTLSTGPRFLFLSSFFFFNLLEDEVGTLVSVPKAWFFWEYLIESDLAPYYAFFCDEVSFEYDRKFSPSNPPFVLIPPRLAPFPFFFLCFTLRARILCRPEIKVHTPLRFFRFSTSKGFCYDPYFLQPPTGGSCKNLFFPMKVKFRDLMSFFPSDLFPSCSFQFDH